MSATSVAALGRGVVNTDFLRQLGRWGTIIGLVVVCAIFALAAPDTFATWDNVKLILDQATLLAIIALGLTIVLVMLDFDLSIGAVATLGGVVGGMVAGDVNPALGIVVGVAAGAGIGVVNGLVVAYLGVSSFIATLGTAAIASGITLKVTNGFPISNLPQGFTGIADQGPLGISIPVFIMIGVALLAWVLLNLTVLGRRIDAIGGNAEATRLAGVKVLRYRLIGFVLTASFAALAGVILAARSLSAASGAGEGFLLDAFTACFLGAVTLRDGEFHVIGTLVGVLLMTVMANGLTQINAPGFSIDIFKGSVLILAVAVSGVTRKLVTR